MNKYNVSVDTKSDKHEGDSDKKKQKKTTLVLAEKQTTGSIGWDTYNAYARAAGGFVYLRFAFDKFKFYTDAARTQSFNRHNMSTKAKGKNRS